MKKVLSIALVLLMVVALAVPSFAMSKDELKALAAKAPAAYQNQILAVVDQMTDAQAAATDTATITSTAKALDAKRVAGTVTAADITSAAATIQAAAPGVTIVPSAVSVSGTTVSAVVETKVNNYDVSVPYSVTGTTTGGTTTGGTGSTGVIKATGMSAATAAIVLALAISGVFGFAIVKSRKVAA